MDSVGLNLSGSKHSFIPVKQNIQNNEIFGVKMYHNLCHLVDICLEHLYLIWFYWYVRVSIHDNHKTAFSKEED